jgi:hypothetical protein
MRLLSAAACAAVLSFATSSAAITILPNPIPLVGSGDFGSITASIELVSTVTGVPAGGSVSIGTTAPTDTTLVFRASVDLASVDGVTVFAVTADDDGDSLAGLISFSGAGVIAGAGVDITLLAFEEVVAAVRPELEVISPGSTTDLFFVSYPIAPGVGEFLIAGAGPTTETPLPVQSAAMVVPEAGTAALLALGLGALGRRATRG